MHVENCAQNQFCLSRLEVNSADITSVYEAFCECEPPKLLDALLSMQANWRTNTMLFSDLSREILLRRVCSSLSVMKKLKPNKSREGEIIMPWQCFEAFGHNGLLQRRIGAAVVSFKNISDAALVLEQYGQIDNMETLLSIISDLGGGSLVDELWETNIVFPADALEDISWPCALGYKLWLPANLTERERYFTLGHLFWALTYEGYCGISVASKEQGERFKTIPLEFYEEYDFKIRSFTELLNYKCWAELVLAAKALEKAA